MSVKRIFSVMLCLVMLVSVMPMAAFAEDDYVCEHEQAHIDGNHTPECGYRQANLVCTHQHDAKCCGHECETAGIGCVLHESKVCAHENESHSDACCATHKQHDAACYKEAEAGCPHKNGTHDEQCGGLEDVTACTHVCTVESGCLVLSCPHVHSAACCGHDCSTDSRCTPAVEGDCKHTAVCPNCPHQQTPAVHDATCGYDATGSPCEFMCELGCVPADETPDFLIVEVNKEYTYTGEEIVPAYADMVVRAEAAGTPLVGGTDYVITGCEKNVNRTDGATVKVVGQGKYADIAGTGTFKINFQDIGKDVIVELEEGPYVYEGDPVEPAVTVKQQSSGKIVPPGNYFVRYGENNTVGEGKGSVVVGPYFDTNIVFEVQEIKFDITAPAQEPDTPTVPDKLEVTLKAGSVPYDGEDHIPEIAEVTFGDKTLDFEKGEYFAPEFYRGEEETEDFTSVGKIRVVVWGTGEADGKYGEAVFEITGNTTPSDELLSLELEKTSVIYNGKEQKPVIKSVKLGEKELDEDEYDVAYGRGASATKNFTDAGIISVTVTGKTQELAGKLCGATYTIKPKEVSTPTIKLERSSYGYTGKAVEPKVSAVYDGSTLIPAKEYTVSYKDNVKLGTGTGKVVVSDKDGGNYTVSGYTTFSIVNNTQYKIILGNGGCWYRGSYYGLGFRCDGPYADFIGITIDGKPVDKAYYVSSEGSTNVGVYPQALNMLGNGTHYITFKYSSGSATGVFYVGSTAINAVMTGDDSNVGLLALVMCLGLLSSVATLSVLRKKKTDA